MKKKYNKLSIEQKNVLRRKIALFKATLALYGNSIKEFALDNDFSVKHFINACNGYSKLESKYIKAIDEYVKETGDLFVCVWAQHLKDIQEPIVLGAFTESPIKLQVDENPLETRYEPTVAAQEPSIEDDILLTKQELEELRSIENDEERFKRYDEIKSLQND